MLRDAFKWSFRKMQENVSDGVGNELQLDSMHIMDSEDRYLIKEIVLAWPD